MTVGALRAPRCPRMPVDTGVGSEPLDITFRLERWIDAEAQADDIVLIAGKGHEQGQIIGSGENMKLLPFDDVTVARECAGGQGGAA